jgi:integrase
MAAIGRRQFGHIRKLPSRRWQASYTGPDLNRHTAPFTFETKMDAEAWLVAERRIVEGRNWIAPKLRGAAEKAAQPPTLRDYSTGWMESRALKPRTHEHYRRLLDRLILPTLAELRLSDLTPTVVRNWHTALGPGTPTLRAHAYVLLRTICTSAVAEQLITINPCVLPGASNAKTVHKPKPATLAELSTIVESMPDRYRLAVLIAAWCGLRFGELTELRRSDIDLKTGYIHVRRGVVRADHQVIVGKPKSDAGVRDVAIPPHLVPAIRRHLSEHVAFGRDALLFQGRRSGQQLAPATLYGPFYKARVAAGREDLRWHDLRHTGATLAAATGATLAELMARIGHSTAGAALRYQHAAKDRDRVIAEALSRMAEVADTPKTSVADE